MFLSDDSDTHERPGIPAEPGITNEPGITDESGITHESDTSDEHNVSLFYTIGFGVATCIALLLVCIVIFIQCKRLVRNLCFLRWLVNGFFHIKPKAMQFFLNSKRSSAYPEISDTNFKGAL